MLAVWYESFKVYDCEKTKDEICHGREGYEGDIQMYNFMCELAGGVMTMYRRLV